MKKPGLLAAFLVFVGLIVVAVWAGIAVAVNDAVWFIPVFGADAAYLELYWEGEQLRFEPGSPDYTLLNEALQEDLPHAVSYPSGAGLSEESLERLRAEGRLLEAHYAEPARVHTRYYFAATTVLYIPLEGHHAALNRVFNRGRGVPLELRSTDAIHAAVETVVRQRGLEPR